MYTLRGPLRDAGVFIFKIKAGVPRQPYRYGGAGSRGVCDSSYSAVLLIRKTAE